MKFAEVVAPTEREVLRLALDLVTGRLLIAEAELLDGATACGEELRAALDPDR
ncbi:hypothetical protein [Nocardia xishanensis]|uniref:hypothetical protein n=1 Tax=Nocardia xishanensis TaxID=238964 RepID=UPI0012F4D1C0|nr:hypothetical protein [Nocardia xishanensis]